jgi:hypothetical protein
MVVPDITFIPPTEQGQNLEGEEEKNAEQPTIQCRY